MITMNMHDDDVGNVINKEYDDDDDDDDDDDNHNDNYWWWSCMMNDAYISKSFYVSFIMNNAKWIMSNKLCILNDVW